MLAIYFSSSGVFLYSELKKNKSGFNDPLEYYESILKNHLLSKKNLLSKKKIKTFL